MSNRFLSLVVIILGVLSLVTGAFFILEGVSKSNYLTTNIKEQRITLGLTPQQIAAGQVVESAAQLQTASDKIRADQLAIAPSYDALLGGKSFNPSDPKQLEWAQALNLENSLNVAVLAFGVTQIAEGAGSFMIVVAIALWVIGVVLWRLARKQELGSKG